MLISNSALKWRRDRSFTTWGIIYSALFKHSGNLLLCPCSNICKFFFTGLKLNVFVCCGYVPFHIFSCVEEKSSLRRWGGFLDCKLFRAGKGLLLDVCTASLLPLTWSKAQAPVHYCNANNKHYWKIKSLFSQLESHPSMNRGKLSAKVNALHYGLIGTY